MNSCGYMNIGNKGGNARAWVDGIDFSEADLVTLALGINDWKHNMPLGTVEDTPEMGTTTCSNMKYCIEKIRGDNPDAKIIVVIPMLCTRWGEQETGWATNIPLSNSKTMHDLWEAERGICKMYGLDYIDLLYDCETITVENAADALPDGVHPSEQTHAELGEEMARKLNELLN